MTALFRAGRLVPHMTANFCPRCGLDTIRQNACTDPACGYPEVTRA